jgi:hypothetical protein
MSTLNIEDITTLDRQIEQLYDYKPIPEHEVKHLCDKVSLSLTIQADLYIGQRNPSQRVECAASEVPSHSVRRYSRLVP